MSIDVCTKKTVRYKPGEKNVRVANVAIQWVALAVVTSVGMLFAMIGLLVALS